MMGYTRDERLLTAMQVTAIDEIRATFEHLNRLRCAVNDKIAANNLPVPMVRMYEVGMLRHQLDTIIFEHDMAEIDRCGNVGFDQVAA